MNHAQYIQWLKQHGFKISVKYCGVDSFNAGAISRGSAVNSVTGVRTAWSVLSNKNGNSGSIVCNVEIYRRTPLGGYSMCDDHTTISRATLDELQVPGSPMPVRPAKPDTLVPRQFVNHQVRVIVGDSHFFKGHSLHARKAAQIVVNVFSCMVVYVGHVDARGKMTEQGLEQDVDCLYLLSCASHTGAMFLVASDGEIWHPVNRRTMTVGGGFGSSVEDSMKLTVGDQRMIMAAIELFWDRLKSK